MVFGPVVVERRDLGQVIAVGEEHAPTVPSSGHGEEQQATMARAASLMTSLVPVGRSPVSWA